MTAIESDDNTVGVAWHTIDVVDALERLDVTEADGLDDTELDRRRSRNGENTHDDRR